MGEKGYEVGFEQLIVNDNVPKLEPVNADGSFEVSEQGRNITIKGNNFEYIFDKSTGNFKKLSDAVTRSVEWNVWRAPTDNDRNIMRDWINADYHREQSYVYVINTQNSIVAFFKFKIMFLFGQFLLRVMQRTE